MTDAADKSSAEMDAHMAQAVEPTPPAAQSVFGERLPLAERYSPHLATTGVEWGLIGPRELDRIWTRHILNCGVAAPLIHDGDVVGDIGSGAGLPGLVLAIAQPNATFVLIEAMARRVDWLTMVIDDLGLNNVRVVRARVEELVDDEVFTVVTARAVKALNVLIEWSVPVLGPEGRLLALKGQKAEEEIVKSAKLIKRHKLTPAVIHLCGEDILEVPTRVVEVRRR